MGFSEHLVRVSPFLGEVGPGEGGAEITAGGRVGVGGWGV